MSLDQLQVRPVGLEHLVPLSSEGPARRSRALVQRLPSSFRAAGLPRHPHAVGAGGWRRFHGIAVRRARGPPGSVWPGQWPLTSKHRGYLEFLVGVLYRCAEP